MQDHILKASCRFNINNQQHKKVYDVLMDLDPNIAKSKSQFLIDAAEFYIDNFGKEFLTTKHTDNSPYVTRQEFEVLEQQMIDKAVTEARNEVIRLLGGMLCGARVSAPVIEATEEKKTVSEETEEDDDTMAALATQWMV